MLDCKTILLIVGVILIFNVMNLYNSSKSIRKAKRITKLELIKKKLQEKFTGKVSCSHKCVRESYHGECKKIYGSKDEKNYMKCAQKKATSCIKANCPK